MKILLLTTHLNMGGIGVYTVNLARYLKREGVGVCVVSSGGELLSRLENEGIEHIEIDIRTKAEFGPKVLKNIFRIADIVRRERVDVIHAQTRVTQVAAALARKITGVPVVTTCHGFFRHRKLSRRFFPCWGDKTIAISRSVKEHLIKQLKACRERVEVVYNGIELDKYISMKKEKDRGLLQSMNMREDVPIAGTVGRLSPVKGYRYLIEAMGIAAARGIELQLLMVGEGPEQEELQGKIKELSLGDRVFMTGGEKPLEEYFPLMDIFCMPSLHEGLGLSLMEAMASGRACIASNIGGLAELIDDGIDGKLVASKDPVALAAGIIELYGDEGKRRKYAANAREKAMRDFSIEISVKKTVCLYRSVVMK